MPASGTVLFSFDNIVKKYESGNYSFLLDADDLPSTPAFSTDQSTAPNSARSKPIRVAHLNVHTDPDNQSAVTMAINVDKYFAMTTYNSISILLQKADSTRKTASMVTYDSATETPDFPYPIFEAIREADLFNFEHMIDYTTVKTSAIGGVTDVLGDHVEFLGFVPGVSDGSFSLSGNTISWDLSGTEPYTGHSYEQVYQLGHDAATGAEDDFFAPVDAYRMIYKVRLKTEASDFVSSVSAGFPLNTNPAGSVYDTNGTTTLSYNDSNGNPAVANYVSPEVRGARYAFSFTKTDASDGPLPGGDYTVTETQAPSGYKRLPTPLTVTLDYTASPTDFTVQGDTLIYPGMGADWHIPNEEGSDPSIPELPSAGGIGTERVYAFAAAFTVTALWLLACTAFRRRRG